MLLIHTFSYKQNTENAFKASLSSVCLKIKILLCKYSTQQETLEKATAPHSGTLAWKIPWMEEPDRLQSMGSQSRTRLSDFTSKVCFILCDFYHNKKIFLRQQMLFVIHVKCHSHLDNISGQWHHQVSQKLCSQTSEYSVLSDGFSCFFEE